MSFSYTTMVSGLCRLYDFSSFLYDAWQNIGQIRVHSGGIVWKKQGGGKAVEVDRSNISEIFWTKVPRSNQLGVRSKDGLYYKFIGFRDQVPSFSCLFINI